MADNTLSQPQATSQVQTPTKRRRRARPVPTLHLVMIRISCGVAALGGIGYYFAPVDKASFFRDISLIALSFLFGKATNGFGERPDLAKGDGEDDGQ